VVGALLISRLVRPDVRAGLVGPLAVAAGVPLVLCAFHPGLALTLVLWALAGVCSSYQVPLIAEYVDALPDGRRGQAMGLASAALLAVQGVGLLAGGALAQGVGVVATIAISGGVGGALALWMAISRSKDRLRAESTN